MRRECVKLCRQALGLNQAGLAELLGVHRSVVSNIESGYRPIHRDFTERFNKHVDVEIQLQVMDLLER